MTLQDVNPSFWKDNGTFSRPALRSLCKDINTWSYFVYVHVCICMSVQCHQRPEGSVTPLPQMELQAVVSHPTCCWEPNSHLLAQQPALDHLAVFPASENVYVCVWARIPAYHSSCVKVRGQLLGVSFLLLPGVPHLELRLSGAWPESLSAEPSWRPWT